jgi:hypothetical protein
LGCAHLHPPDKEMVHTPQSIGQVQYSVYAGRDQSSSPSQRRIKDAHSQSMIYSAMALLPTTIAVWQEILESSRLKDAHVMRPLQDDNNITNQV